MYTSTQKLLFHSSSLVFQFKYIYFLGGIFLYLYIYIPLPVKQTVFFDDSCCIRGCLHELCTIICDLERAANLCYHTENKVKLVGFVRELGRDRSESR